MLVGNVVHPEHRPGEDVERYNFCKRMFRNTIWSGVLRIMNSRQHGFVDIPPGFEEYCHVVPRIGPVIQDIKEQTMTAGVLQSYAVRCGTCVRATYRFSDDTASVVSGHGGTVTRSAASRPTKRGRSARPSTGRRQVTASCTSSGSGVTEAAQAATEKAAAKAAADHAQKVALYHQRLKAGLARCSRFRDPKLRQRLLDTHGRSPDEARPNPTAAVAAFEDEGLHPYVAVAWEDPEFDVLMGGITLAERMVTEEFHVVRELPFFRLVLIFLWVLLWVLLCFRTDCWDVRPFL
jgi:hypothetical protein